jgi:hypothetical protein
LSCPNCEMNVDEHDLFCSACGKRLSGNQENELYTFGPWLVNVCFSRPGTFVLMHKNDTKIVLTNQRIYGFCTLTNSTRFQVPYSAILAKENFDYRLNLGLWNVLWIRYKEAEKIKEVSIMCFGANSAHSTEAFRIISTHSTYSLST